MTTTSRPFDIKADCLFAYCTSGAISMQSQVSGCHFLSSVEKNPLYTIIEIKSADRWYWKKSSPAARLPLEMVRRFYAP